MQHVKLHDSGNTTFLNLWNEFKALLSVEITALNIYIRKEENL